MPARTPLNAPAERSRGRRASTCRSLMRLLALYLAVILGWQMVAAAHIQGAGVLHLHEPASPAARSYRPSSVATTAHEHGHGARHWHGSDAGVRLQDDPSALGAAAQALLAAMAALMAAIAWPLAPVQRRGVRPAWSPWPALTLSTPTPWRPPRPGSAR